MNPGMQCLRYIAGFLLLILTSQNLFGQSDSLMGFLERSRLYQDFFDFGEKVLDRLTWERGRSVLVVYPAGGYSQRTGLEMGVMPVLSWQNKKEELRVAGHPNTFTSTVQFSTSGMLELRGEVELFPSSKWQLRSKLNLLKLNDRLWPIGDNNKDYVTYRSKRFEFSGEVLYGVGAGLFVGGAAQLLGFNFSDWGVIAYPMAIEGLEGGGITGIGPSVLYDTRSHVYYPRKGFYIKGAAEINFESAIGDYAFRNYLIDFRKYVSFRKKVLANQLLWEYAPGKVPFFMLPKLGGSDRLRGVGHSQQVIDKHVWLVQSELRFPLWWRLGGVGFVGMGQARPEPEIEWHDLIYSGGVGLRFRILPNDPLNVRLDAALATGGRHGIFISLKEAF